MNELLFEQILTEASKARFINKADLTDEEKEKYIKFFDSHPQADRLINWQKASEITKDNLEKIYSQFMDNAHQSQLEKEKYRFGIKNPKEMFNKHTGDLEIIDENEKWLFVRVLTYKGAIFCDSAECGGQGAKWCIGDTDNRVYWDNYTANPPEDEDDESETGLTYEEWEADDEGNSAGNIFILAYNKTEKVAQNERKYMLRINNYKGTGEAWKQDDKIEDCIELEEWPTFFNIKINPKSDIDYVPDIRNKGKHFYGYKRNLTINIGNTEITCKNIRKTEYTEPVIIPEGVESIIDAFKNATVGEILFPKSLKSIDNAFIRTNFINKKLVLPDSVNYISNTAFMDSILEVLELPESLNDFCIRSIPKNLKTIVIKGKPILLDSKLYHFLDKGINLQFDGDFKNVGGFIIRTKETYCCGDEIKVDTLEAYIGEPTVNLVIPEGVQHIGVCFVENMSSSIAKDITTVTLPSTIKTIGHNAFRGMERLSTINNLENVEYIGFNAFSNCKRLPYVLSFNNDKFFMENDAFNFTRVKMLFIKNKDVYDNLIREKKLVLMAI